MDFTLEMVDSILHITEHESWQEAQRQGQYTASSLETEGFIHCSENEEQAVFAASLFFKHRSGLPVLVIDTGKLKSPVKREQVDDKWFPHVYGPINVDAVLEVRTLVKEEDGSHSVQ